MKIFIKFHRFIWHRLPNKCARTQRSFLSLSTDQTPIETHEIPRRLQHKVPVRVACLSSQRTYPGLNNERGPSGCLERANFTPFHAARRFGCSSETGSLFCLQIRKAFVYMEITAVQILNVRTV